MMNMALVAPYESHDGPIGWTVQEADEDGDANGGIVAEFDELEDAVMFLAVKELKDQTLYDDNPLRVAIMIRMQELMANTPEQEEG